MNSNWRWDQGGLNYFSLNKIRIIASVLSSLEGYELNSSIDPLRDLLEEKVGLPFAPKSYRVWRNYARVFKVLGLASKIDGKIQPTNLCKKLLDSDENYLTYDEYIQYIVKSFYYPSPIFQGYNTTDQQVFPFCAIIKLLVSNAYSGSPCLELKDVFDLLIGNSVTGLDEIEFYRTLKSSGLEGKGGQERQVREMLIFISQLSFLSWIDAKLFIDISAFSNLSNIELSNLLRPVLTARVLDQEAEIQNIFSIDLEVKYKIDLKEPISSEDEIFTEGKKIRVSHLMTERNRRLVKYYFDNADHPRLCDLCEHEVANSYPWMKNLIEVHHILPLSSPINVNRAGTSINDLVGLCPNCHRATHAYYRNYLKDEGISDFTSDGHARDVYEEVKSHFVAI